MKIQGQFILGILILTFIFSCGKIPSADFSVDNELLMYDPIEFSYTGTEADSYLWDFGDGSTAATENPSHKYSAAGDYTVNLTATNSEGSHTTAKDIAIRAILEGEYAFMMITFTEALNTGNLILTGPYNVAGMGAVINITNGQPVAVSIIANFSVENYDLTFELEQIVASGAFGIPTSFVIDTRKMTGVKIGNTYFLSNDDFSFQLIKI